MNLQLLRPGEASPSAEEIAARAVSAIALPEGVEPPPRAPGIAIYSTVNAAGTCPHDDRIERLRTAMHHEIDGVLLDTPDAWYHAGQNANWCGRCEADLATLLREEYGPQLLDVSRLHSTETDETDGPFWREREALRLRAALKYGARLAQFVRDETRRERELEMQVGARFLGVSAVSVDLARRIDFAVIEAAAPRNNEFGVGGMEILRAALYPRPLSVLAPDAVAAKPALLLQAARIAAATGADLALPSSAPRQSHLALTAHRHFWREFRSRHRPADRLAEVLVLYSARSDHWSYGKHGAAVVALAEELTRANVQYRIVLTVPRGGSEPLLLTGCSYLDTEDGSRVERRLTEGASVIVIGQPGVVDEFGRPLPGPLSELSEGLNRVGSGSAIQLAALVDLEKALDSLLGRGRRAVTASRPTVMVKMYLDPDRKLDVYLVGRQFDAATGAAEEIKGLTLHLAGSAVSGARAGYLFAMEEPERKVPLTAFGMGVQAVLPDFRGAAVLTITR